MQYYSTNNKHHVASLSDVVLKGLASDSGLFMPATIPVFPPKFFDNIQHSSLQEMAYSVAFMLFGEDIHANVLKMIVYDTLSFDIPLVKVEDNIYSLELYHGPTLAFKDVGARFMSRVLRHIIQVKHQQSRQVNVLVATSGDTGSAVANGFLGVEGVRVYVLYPKGLVSPIQECQFTTLGQNIVAVEVDGTFDDCQYLVKQAFLDQQLHSSLFLTSANSINVARFLPQAFYYFYAYAQLKRISEKAASQMVFSVPSGNFGNITAGLFAQHMGLPVKRFLAANNRNDVFLEYLNTGMYHPRPSVATIANAMDVGNPSNFARILDLYHHNHAAITQAISGEKYDDSQIKQTIKTCYNNTGYLLDPHGACGYQALKDHLQPGETGVFLETAHPAKFLETVEDALGSEIEIPQSLQAFLQGAKQRIALSKDFEEFKKFLLEMNELS